MMYTAGCLIMPRIIPRHCEERSDEAIQGRGALTPGLLRCARNDEVRASPFSRRVFLRPSLGKPLHESVCLQINKGRRSAERRIVNLRTGTSDERIRVRGRYGERHECFALPRTSACGRPRLSALRRGTFQLRAAFYARRSKLSPPPTPLSELLADRSIVPAERGPKPPGRSLRNRARAPQLAPPNGTPPVDALMSELESPCRHPRNNV